MHLEKLGIQGFKSFANKIDLEFGGDGAADRGLTAIVGPNGSGKSNVADAIGWALGEQSVKLLGGKKSEDVIFYGTDGRARAGMAEVSLYLDNSDRAAPVDFEKLIITRRLYRDGTSEYLVNKNKVRLADIQLLLAQANFGQRTYSVIGQGTIEAFLLMSPAERKDFFDEAAGVKHLEIKRNQAIGKLESTAENIKQAETLLAEIEPRLRSLTRQVKRLEQRSELEGELYTAEHLYYGMLWQRLAASLTEYRGKLGAAEEKTRAVQNEVAVLRKKMIGEAKENALDEGLAALQKEYEKLNEEKNALKESDWRLRTELERSKIVVAKNTPPFPLPQIIEELKAINESLSLLLRETDPPIIIEKIKEIKEKHTSLLNRLSPREVSEELKSNPKLERDINEAQKKILEFGEKMSELQNKMRERAAKEQDERRAFFAAQEALAEKQDELRRRDDDLNQIKIELARLETRKESLEQEMAAELKERTERIKEESKKITPAENVETLLPQIQRLRYQLELIGGIDTETMREYEETKSRNDFLVSQISDLRAAIDDTYKIIEELDLSIKSRFEEAFNQINDDFGRYFKMLFRGGHAELVKVARTEDEEGLEEAGGNKLELAKKLSEWSGLEINAVPPGKRVKTIGMLSGGERALTSIALLSAIIANNPSPFVVLDEVDASLDEANSIRFAEIIGELGGRTQFILITHNRYTMERAGVLYGVTMGDDGVSRLLSLRLEEVKSYER